MEAQRKQTWTYRKCNRNIRESPHAEVVVAVGPRDHPGMDVAAEAQFNANVLSLDDFAILIFHVYDVA
jgi:hypothetical protein